jgi:hypothetical protein
MRRSTPGNKILAIVRKMKFSRPEQEVGQVFCMASCWNKCISLLFFVIRNVHFVWNVPCDDSRSMSHVFDSTGRYFDDRVHPSLLGSVYKRTDRSM